MSHDPDPRDLPTTDSQSVSRGVVKAGGIMAISLILSRFLGLARDSIMAGMFGASLEADAYKIAFLLPDTLFFLLSGGALSSAFIPVFTEYWVKGQKQDAWKVFSGVLSIVGLILAVAMLGLAIFADPIFRNVLARDNPEEFYPLVVQMSRILLPAQFAFFLGGLMMGTLYARGVFTIPGLGPNIYNIGIILGALVLSKFVSPAISGMCWGATIGAIAGNLLIPGLVITKMGMTFTPSLRADHPGVKKVFKLMLPVVLGLSLPSVFNIIIQSMASAYASGTNVVIDNANRLMQAPLGIFGQSLAIAVFPALSSMYAQGQMHLFKDQTVKTLRTTLYLAIPASVMLFVMAEPLCWSLFRHGQYTSEAAKLTASCLQIFSIGIWAWCAHPVMMRAFYAMQDTLTPVVLGTVTTGIFVVLAVVLRSMMGLSGLTLAGSIAPMILVVLMGTSLRRKLGELDLGSVATCVGQSFVGSAGMAMVAAIVVKTRIGESALQGKLATILMTLATFLVGMWVYYGLTRLFKMPETAYLDRTVSRVWAKLGRGQRSPNPS